MTASRFSMVPASTLFTAASPGQKAETYGGGIGFAIRDGQLVVAIKEEGAASVMVAALHESVLDAFCGMLADHLAEVSPEAARLMQEREPWPSLQ